MNRLWLMLLPVALLAACQGTGGEPQQTAEPTATVTSAPGEVTEPTPSVTSTVGHVTGPRPRVTSTPGQMMWLEEREIRQGPDGTYYVPDQGDGCEYHQAGPPSTPVTLPSGLVLPPQVMLWATPPVPAQCEAGWSYEPSTGRINVVVP